MRLPIDQIVLTFESMNGALPRLTGVQCVALNGTTGQHDVQTRMAIVDGHAQHRIVQTSKCFQIRSIEQASVDQRVLSIVIRTDVQVSERQQRSADVRHTAVGRLPLQWMDVDRRDRLRVRECQSIDEFQLGVIIAPGVHDLDAVRRRRRIIVEHVDEPMDPIDFQRGEMEEGRRPDLFETET